MFQAFGDAHALRGGVIDLLEDFGVVLGAVDRSPVQNLKHNHSEAEDVGLGFDFGSFEEDFGGHVGDGEARSILHILSLHAH